MFNETAYSYDGLSGEKGKAEREARRLAEGKSTLAEKRAAQAAAQAAARAAASQPRIIQLPKVGTGPTDIPITNPTMDDGSASSGGGITDFFKNIPSTYLWIGGGVLLFMMFKKR